MLASSQGPGQLGIQLPLLSQGQAQRKTTVSWASHQNLALLPRWGSPLTFKCLLSICYMPGPALGAAETNVNKTESLPSRNFSFKRNL